MQIDKKVLLIDLDSQVSIGSLLPDPRLAHRAKLEQRVASQTTGTRHHESDGSDWSPSRHGAVTPRRWVWRPVYASRRPWPQSLSTLARIPATWDEIDEAGGVIRLSPGRSKTLVGRILPMSQPIAEALARVLSHLGRGTGMLLDVSCCLSMNCQRPRVERSGSKAAILPGA